MYEVFLIEQTFFKKIGIIYALKSLYFHAWTKIPFLWLKITQNKVGFKAFFIKN